MNESKNFIIAASLSLLVIFIWDIYNAKNAPKKNVTQNIKVEKPDILYNKHNSINETKTAEEENKNIFVEFENDKIIGKISLNSLRFTKLSLKNYYEKSDKKSLVNLLDYDNSDIAYFVESGWMINNINGAGNKINWQIIKGKKLTDKENLELKWSSLDKNIEIYRSISLDKDYLFTIKDRVVNKANFPITVNQYALINRVRDEQKQQFFILHEGPFGVFNDSLVESSYKKILKKEKYTNNAINGWAGISDKYWYTAFIPDKNKNFDYRFIAYKKNNKNKYQVDMQSEDIIVPAAMSYETTNLFFAGAKEIELIDKYQKKYDIALFDRGIDFGILYFLTKPIYLLLKIFYNYFNNFGLAIIFLTIFIRILMYPLASKSFREITKMKNIQPEIIKLRDLYGDDKMRMQREVMKLYQTHKIKPMMGCMPVLVQVFIFFALYKVLFVTIDMRHAPFFGWITDLTAPDPTCLFNLFGLIPFNIDIPFGVWPCLLCITMILQQKLNPVPADPMQAKMMKFIPYLFVILFAGFPAGLVIYWTFNNSFSIAQQYLIMKKTERELNK
jgi:YidC/Oxa1 family membrane protein insertase